MSIRRRIFTLTGMALALSAAAFSAQAAPAQGSQHITVASTTSTENSGLFGYLLPRFEKQTGIEVRVVAVGTGAALDLGKRCDADALLVHAKQKEEQYVQDGYGVDRHDVMYNDFILVGPKDDPAHIRGLKSAAEALQKIADSGATFLSRGDESGTHVKERSLWTSVHVEPWEQPGSKWYRETGAGMGSTLNTASAMNGYTLTDRATWVTFQNKGDLAVLLEGDPKLFNQYGVMRVNPERCPNVKTQAASEFSTWLLSPQGQQTIASYQLDGIQLFHPNAK